ncbi:MAG: DTW domain-containing protein [Rhizobacter sp.]|nr:DTW domain-containing protein [Bacteriovorax sp.]
MEQVSTEYLFASEGRAFCPDCEFLKSRCLCDTLKSVPNKIHLIVLQHPTESKHPLNTVRIMNKSFKKMTVMTGEDFTSDLKLNTILCDQNNECALLYPGEEAKVLDKSFSQKELTHLILIDGTWRKAKKIFMLSKNLQTLPSLKLAPTEHSDYRIRKSPTDSALSTLEATIEALHFLEPDLDTTAATKSFQKMIDFQIKKMGREVYQTNYLDKKKE